MNWTVRDKGEWHRWFAWYPVRVESHRWAWLQMVETRTTLSRGLDAYTECRLLDADREATQ